jgi:hypothetical protein
MDAIMTSPSASSHDQHHNCDGRVKPDEDPPNNQDGYHDYDYGHCDHQSDHSEWLSVVGSPGLGGHVRDNGSSTSGWDSHR